MIAAPLFVNEFFHSRRTYWCRRLFTAGEWLIITEHSIGYVKYNSMTVMTNSLRLTKETLIPERYSHKIEGAAINARDKVDVREIPIIKRGNGIFGQPLFL